MEQILKKKNAVSEPVQESEISVAAPEDDANNYEKKLHTYFRDMIVMKSSSNVKLFSDLGLPSYIRDWLVMRFADDSGVIDAEKVIDYVRWNIPDKEQWNHIVMELLLNEKSVRFLTRIKIELDTRTRQAFFALPAFEIPRNKGGAVADWDVVENNKDLLLANNEVWGIVEITLVPDEKGKENIFRLVNFKPFCPYSTSVDYYRRAREFFSIDEWIDVLISAVDYNPKGYRDKAEKLAVLKRLLPFVEKRLNLVELAPKETGKSYIFSRITKHGWLVSGGSVTRAKMFYDINKKSDGLAAEYDYVALDEIQSIKFDNPAEMQGILKGYLESGEYRVGTHRGCGDAGMVLLGNIDAGNMDINKNMFMSLPAIFRESALIDRFHGFVKGWEMPKMREELKADGWALNTEYFSEILHQLRDEPVYRAVVDELLVLPKDAATRDTEAIKRSCTAYLKLLFPDAVSADRVNRSEFEEYCLKPAMEMRGIIKTQLGIIDPGEFGGAKIPDITVKEDQNADNR